MASVIGKDTTNQKVVLILLELLKDENSEVKMNTIGGLINIAQVVGQDMLTSGLLN